MKRGITLILALSLTTVLVTAAEDKPATPTPAAEQKPMDIPGLKDQKERLSYAIGMSIGTSFKRGNYDLDFDVFMMAIKDVLATNTTKMTDAQSREIITTHNKEMAAKREEERKQASETNRKAGDAFLAENAKKEGVKTQTATLPDGTKAEFQYKELKAGDGSVPRTNDMVTVNYRGTLLDGKEFDSSAKRGQPAKFAVDRVIPGWTAALTMMKVGSKWEVYLPAALAYGDRGTPAIPPGSALIFEVELLGTEPQQMPSPSMTAPPRQQPLTSDIIRVPSAEEMKKGAKIEVLKQEEAERLAKEAEAKKEAEKK